MDDLMSKLQSILSTQEGQQQLKNIQEMLGGQTANTEQKAQSGTNSSGGGFDFSSLAGMLGNMGDSQQASPPSSQENSGNNGFNFSSLAGMLGNMNQSQPASSNSGSGQLDFSALAQMLGMNKQADANSTSVEQENSAPFPNIDMNMIMKLQKAFQGMKVNDKNSQLLMALKPHFGEKRKAKVDQAISMMRLFSMLPMLKDSGIFAGL